MNTKDSVFRRRVLRIFWIFSKKVKLTAWALCWLAAPMLAQAADSFEKPPQAAEARAVHHAGQTFITWKEAQPLLAGDNITYGQYKQALAKAKDSVRYRVYAADGPISADNIAKAQLLAEVEPLSAYNVNARNKEYLIGQAMIKADEMGELAEGFNHAMHTWTMDSPRMDRYPLKRFMVPTATGKDEPAELPAGTGLFVCNPEKAGKRCYAVVSLRGGVENNKEFASNVTAPVEETVGPGEPICQGQGLHGPYFDFPGARMVYVQWCSPPLAPRPGMYFNWSVLIPPGIQKGQPVLPGMKAYTKAPVELYFHPAGYSYAQPGQRMMAHSIQVAPHDYPASGWYGFNSAWGTPKPLEGGQVSNHTQKRIVAFLDWAKQALPIDADQIIAAGADGAAALALNYPDMFAYVWITGFDSSVLAPAAEKELAAVWGPREGTIKDDQGRANWQWADLDKLATAAGKDLPLFICLGKSWGEVKGYAKGNGRFYLAMQEAHEPLMAYWGWSGVRNRGEVNRFEGTWRGKLITRTTPIPAFSNSSRDADKESDGTAGGRFDWKDLTDAKDKFSMTILSGAGTFDLTLRRLTNFKPAAGQTLQWTADAQPDPRFKAETKPAPQALGAPERGGTITIGKDGLIMIPKLNYPDRVAAMILTITVKP